MKPTLLVCLLLALPSVCFAQFKCIDRNGNLMLTDTPCPTGSATPKMLKKMENPYPPGTSAEDLNKVLGSGTASTGTASSGMAQGVAAKQSTPTVIVKPIDPAISAGYRKLHNAILHGNLQQFLDSFASARRRQLEKASDQGLEQAFQMVKAVMPKEVQLMEAVMDPAGDKATLKAKGRSQGVLGGAVEDSYGTIEMVRENGSWKVDKQSWSNREWNTSQGMDFSATKKTA